MSRLWIIAYDIVDDGVRGRVHDILKDYGERVQYSVFECRLNDAALKTLRTRVNAEIDEPDKVRWYPLCAWCADQVAWQGTGSPPEDDRFFLV